MPNIRADIIDIYLFRRDAEGAIELLQLLRAAGKVACGGEGGGQVGPWHPVMGHVEAGETAVACAVRELHEEVGLLRTDADFRGMWSLEQVHPYFVPEWDAVVMSPRFAVEVAPGWMPVLNAEHLQHRWVAARDADAAFLWPGQKACIREILEMLARPELKDALRVRAAAASEE